MGTVGRLGFKDITWGGSSAHENLDYWLFLILYFISLASGIASLKPESTSAAVALPALTRDKHRPAASPCWEAHLLLSPENVLHTHV